MRSDIPTALFILAVFLLIVLFIGSPDLHDALIGKITGAEVGAKNVAE